MLCLLNCMTVVHDIVSTLIVILTSNSVLLTLIAEFLKVSHLSVSPHPKQRVLTNKLTLLSNHYHLMNPFSHLLPMWATLPSRLVHLRR